uniref:Uncharacterized protein n=1 Tax=Anopheles coluzzii TaxID=1518534 RepID=A0A8W7PJY3_ANOCL
MNVHIRGSISCRPGSLDSDLLLHGKFVLRQLLHLHSFRVLELVLVNGWLAGGILLIGFVQLVGRIDRIQRLHILRQWWRILRSRPPPEANRKGMKSRATNPYCGSMLRTFSEWSTSAMDNFMRFEWCINLTASCTICFSLYDTSSASSLAASSGRLPTPMLSAITFIDSNESVEPVVRDPLPDEPTSPGVIDTRKSRNLAAFTCVCCAPYPVDPATFLPATVNSATGSRETDTRNHHPTGRHHPPTRTFSRGHFLPPVPRYPSGLPLFPVEDNPLQSRVSRKAG